jgi:hypothetical protein
MTVTLSTRRIGRRSLKLYAKKSGSVSAPTASARVRRRPATTNQLNRNPPRQPGMIQYACTPEVNAQPTSPSVTHPLSLEAEADRAATHGPSDRPARKKSSSLRRAYRAE